MAVDQFSASEIIFHQNLLSYGHEIRYTFSLHNAAALQEDWHFMKEFETGCEMAPTAWKIRMTLERATNRLLVSGTAKLKRSDSMKVPVRIFFAVKILHDEFKSHIPTPDVEDIANPGDEFIINVSSIVPHKCDYLLRDKLSVLVHIYIRDCHHRKQKVFSKPGSSGKTGGKLHCSKL
ncbi:unnamed protein product [Larinioides sclopetarius]|uniref:Uncharacterized protein n=1 Tax=Larinioides sclopetarius TaxID=280406 RepID=A0AAV1ZFN8_9ARAC